MPSATRTSSATSPNHSRARRDVWPVMSSGRDREERLYAPHLAPQPGLLLAAVLGAAQAVLGLLEPCLERRAVEVLGPHGVLDDQQGRVVDDLEVALALREAHGGGGLRVLRAALVEPQLGRLEHCHQRRV